MLAGVGVGHAPEDALMQGECDLADVLTDLGPHFIAGHIYTRST